MSSRRAAGSPEPADGRDRGLTGERRRSVALAAFLAGLREYARTPVLLALFLFLPAYLVGAFTRLVPSTTAPLAVQGDGTVMVEVANVYAVFMTPLVGALVGALAGLFLMDTARGADTRLVVAGARPVAVVLARFGLLGTVGLLVAAVSVATAATTYVPERPVILVGAVALAALIYGLLGLLAGLVVDRLAGVYLAMFGTMLDLFFLQNPLAGGADYADLLPGYAPVELAVDAGFSTTVALDPLWTGAVWVVGLATVAVLALYWRSLVA